MGSSVGGGEAGAGTGFTGTSVGITMDVHICSVIEKLRGSRPGVNTSFAALGVDSLGAIMFVKQLSDSLGGIRIQPTTIFAPGVTIKQYGFTLFERLQHEKPDTLIKKGLVTTLRLKKYLLFISDLTFNSNFYFHFHRIVKEFSLPRKNQIQCCRQLKMATFRMTLLLKVIFLSN